MGSLILRKLKEYNILGKVLAVTLENATNNKVAIDLMNYDATFKSD